jgi:acyl-CoA thioester hydrolase
MDNKYIYELRLKVRDYECDLQGIVNNANYQHYIEHTRHEFLLSAGVSFADLHRRGIDAVVARLNMSFKTPLKSGDEFVSCLYLKKEGIKYVFFQDIYRLPDNQLCIRSRVDSVCLVNGRLSACPELDDTFRKFLTSEEQ